jgi:hypothetical protein
MAKKTVLIVIGGILTLCGLGCVVPGTLVAVFAGTDNTLASDFHAVGTGTPALVSETARISDAAPGGGTAVPNTTLRITGRSEDEIFLGVARASDVDRYLDGVAIDQVRDFELTPYRVDTLRRDGRLRADPPVEQDFWVAEASGRAPTLVWPVEQGDYRVVIMNADGSPGVFGQAQFGLQIRGLFGVGLVWAIVALLVAVIGVVLLILGIRRRTPQHPTVATPP